MSINYRQGASVSAFTSPHPLEVARDVRSSRPRKRIKVTDEVLEDIASIYRQYGQRGYTRVLMERYGWQKEHAQRMKGRAVAEGFLPEVEDGRGRKARQEKKSMSIYIKAWVAACGLIAVMVAVGTIEGLGF